MIANIDVDPRNPNRLFVAALGHPYGPNAERGIFRSTDGGATFDKVLYKDEYTSGNDVRIDPKDPNIVYATLWQQQQGFIENGAFGGTGGGIFKSTDGGNNWRQLTAGLPTVIAGEPRDRAEQSEGAVRHGGGGVRRRALPLPAAGGRGGRGGGGGSVGFYKSTDGGEHWALAANAPRGGVSQTASPDPRPLARIGGGDLPTITVDPQERERRL